MKISLLILLSISVALVQSVTIPESRTKQYLRRRSETNGRIIGGKPAEIENFPHMMVLIDLNERGFICGASAIHELWAVTGEKRAFTSIFELKFYFLAAHCLEFNTPPLFINLRGGTTNRLYGGRVFFAESYTLNPLYDPILLEYDIALVKVTNFIQGPNIQIIPISPRCEFSCCQACEDDEATITGWG